MKQVWTVQARRIDAMSLRERVFMFVSVALALGAVADMAVLAPALAERRQLTGQMRQQAQQIEALRAQFAANAPGGAGESPQGRQRAAIDRSRGEQRALDQQINAQLASREEIARLPVVLDRLLRQHDRLVLVRLAMAAPAAPAAAPAAATVRWQGVDLSVAGTYPDLVQYLTELEKALPGLRWGPLQIATPSLPPVLSVRLMLVAEAS